MVTTWFAIGVTSSQAGHFFLYRDAGRSAIVRPRRSRRKITLGISRDTRRKTFHDRRGRDPARSPAHHHDTVGRGSRFFWPLAACQKPLHASTGCFGRGDLPQPAWRIRIVAETILGAHHSRRGRFRTLRQLHPFQPGQARPCPVSVRLAIFVAPSLRPRRLAACRLGRIWPDRRQLRRTRRLPPDCAALHPGYGLC